MLAETAKLAIQLDLKGNAAAGIRGVEQRLTGLNRQTGQIGQGFKTMGAGIGVAARNIVLLGTAVVGGLAAGLIKSVKEGQEAAKVQTIYAKAIANSAKGVGTLGKQIDELERKQAKAKPKSKEYDKLATSIGLLKAQMSVMGPVTAAQTAALNKQQTALMNLGGVDDELIKTEQTRLIQMGLNGSAVAKLTPLILDMSKATGRDLLTSTIAVGKAVNGNVAGLQRFGIVIDKAKAKVDPFGAVVDALNKKFGGTTKALSGSLEARLGAFRENLANIREEAGMKLLPALTKIVDVAGRKLVPAFGAFVDRILPSVISGLDKFAAILEDGGAENGIKGITDALGPMVEMLKIAAAPVKLIVDAFLKLPSQVQGVLIGAFAVNKLSGGLIGSGLAQIVKGALGGGLLQRGGSPANPLYVSDIAGGLGGATGAAGAAGKGLGLVSKVFLVGEAIGLAVLVNDVRQGIADASTKQSQALQGQLSEFLGKQPDQAGIENALKGVKQGIVDLESSNLPLFLVQGDALDNLKKMRVELEQQLAEAKGARLTGNLGRPGPMLLTIAGKLTALQAQLHADLLSAIGVLKTSSDPAAIAAAVAKAEASIKGGAGSAGTTKGVLADLKAQLKTAESTGNKDLAGKIRAAIKDIEPFAKGRQWQQAQIAEARKIVASNKTTAQKVAALKSIEDGLLAHQRTMAAQIVGGLMDVVSAVKGIPGQSPTINQYTGFTVPGGTPKPGPRKPTVLSGDSPGQGHAAGFLGLTTGTSDLGIAGEAGPEAVAIVKNPKAIRAGIARVFVTNWPDGNGGTSQRVDTPTITKAKQDADQLKEAIKAIKARAIAAGHRGTDEKNRKTLASDIKRGISMDDILHRKPMVIHAKVTSSIKDTADAIIVRGRWGKTAAQAGGA